MSSNVPSDLNSLDFGVWATQGGGLARESAGTYVWYEVPVEFPGFSVGRAIPEEWDVVAVNRIAKEAVRADEFSFED